MHWPEALQVDWPVYTSLAQVSVAQTVPVAYLRQPPVESHLPSVPHEAALMSTQMARGSAAPTATRAHLPARLGSAQLRHEPWHAFSQQTPSTQC
jgi:hypothetical protein